MTLVNAGNKSRMLKGGHEEKSLVDSLLSEQTVWNFQQQTVRKLDKQARLGCRQASIRNLRESLAWKARAWHSVAIGQLVTLQRITCKTQPAWCCGCGFLIVANVPRD
jgi:hypothetical protein